jgi:hypothetical protein
MSVVSLSTIVSAVQSKASNVLPPALQTKVAVYNSGVTCNLTYVLPDISHEKIVSVVQAKSAAVYRTRVWNGSSTYGYGNGASNVVVNAIVDQGARFSGTSVPHWSNSVPLSGYLQSYGAAVAGNLATASNLWTQVASPAPPTFASISADGRLVYGISNADLSNAVFVGGAGAMGGASSTGVAYASVSLSNAWLGCNLPTLVVGYSLSNAGYYVRPTWNNNLPASISASGPSTSNFGISFSLSNASSVVNPLVTYAVSCNVTAGAAPAFAITGTGVASQLTLVGGAAPLAGTSNTGTLTLTVGNSFDPQYGGGGARCNSAPIPYTLYAAGAPTVGATFPTTWLGVNSNASIPLASYFSSAASLAYSVPGNPKANASVTGSTLSVTGQNSASTYSVVVRATDPVAQWVENTLVVMEKGVSVEYPPTNIGAGNAWVKDTTVTFPGYQSSYATANATYATYYYDLTGASYANGRYRAWANQIYLGGGTALSATYGNDEWPPSGAFDKRQGQGLMNAGWHLPGNWWKNSIDMAGTGTGNGPSGDLFLLMPASMCIQSYSMQVRNDCCLQQFPSKWELYGSNATTPLTLIDSQAGQSVAALAQSNTYNCTTNSNAYNQYKLRLLRNNSAGLDFMSVGELRLYGY